jgi:NAD(P)-dependent dehydrogenase (short-subunit alcohol dehydrogenase family)
MIKLPTTPSFRLEGRRALVTGAGRGIGLAASAALAQAGAAVTLCARSTAEIEAGASAIREAGGKADTLTLDVSDVTAARDALASQGPFDILVNNAGTNRIRSFTDVTLEDYEVVFGLNVKGAFFAAQAVAARMVEAGKGGSIINMSSQMGQVGGSNRSLYCASKWAVEGMSKAMALDLAPHGIRVNTICPTFIVTPLTKPILADDAFRAHVMSMIKLGRLGQVEDLMGAIVFLASDASALMTGSALVVDGGWTAS